MRRNGPARYYGRLMPEERFRLDPVAMACGDAESPGLLRTVAFGPYN
jgi:hypothetical protein